MNLKSFRFYFGNKTIFSIKRQDQKYMYAIGDNMTIKLGQNGLFLVMHYLNLIKDLRKNLEEFCFVVHV